MGKVENGHEEYMSALSNSVFIALDELLFPTHGSRNFTFDIEPVSSPGENSYGQVVKVEAKPKIDPSSKPTSFILKLSPKNEARRTQMNVVEYYTREVFIYKNVLKEYAAIQEEFCIPARLAFTSTPQLYYSSLADSDEFLIFENLQQLGFTRFNRHRTLTFAHTSVAIRELARFHAMSFVLQIKKPKLFQDLVEEIRRDNLFNDDLEEVSIEFAKKYIDRTVAMIKEAKHVQNKEQILAQLQHTRDEFKNICMELVNGDHANPHAVICHGDFWSNNILYKNDENGSPIAAKILDFQMSRYASPVLDFVHFLFACTEKSLRDNYFEDLKQIYHQSLSDQLRLFGLEPDAVFSYSTFEEHLRRFGYYGFCISIFAIPFIISQSSDLPDMDVVSEAARQIYKEHPQNGSSECTERSDRVSALVDEFEILNESTIPIFRKRIVGVVLDLIQYNMLDYVS